MSNTYTVSNNQPLMPRVLCRKKDEDFTDDEKELLKRAVGNYIEEDDK